MLRQDRGPLVPCADARDEGRAGAAGRGTDLERRPTGCQPGEPHLRVRAAVSPTSTLGALRIRLENSAYPG